MTTPNNTNSDPFDLADLIKEEKAQLISKVDTTNILPKDQMERATANRIVIDYARHYKVSPKLAAIAISRLVQDGGTNSGKPNLTRTLDGVEFSLETLRTIIKLVDPNGTVRKLAKTISA